MTVFEALERTWTTNEARTPWGRLFEEALVAVAEGLTVGGSGQSSSPWSGSWGREGRRVYARQFNRDSFRA
jgi:hypothetical protein